MSPFQSNERIDLASSSSSWSSLSVRHREAMHDVETRPMRRAQSSPLSCLSPFTASSSSSEAPPLLDVFAITRFLKCQVPTQLKSFSPRNASSSKRCVEDDGGVEVNVEESLRRSYDLSRV